MLDLFSSQDLYFEPELTDLMNEPQPGSGYHLTGYHFHLYSFKPTKLFSVSFLLHEKLLNVFPPLQNPLHFTTARISSPFAPFACDWFCSFFYQFFLEWGTHVFHSFITLKYYYTARDTFTIVAL